MKKHLCIACSILRMQCISALSWPCIQHCRCLYTAAVLNLWMLQPIACLMFSLNCLKCQIFSHFGDICFLNHADSAKTFFMINVTFIEIRNTSTCNDVFCKSLIRPAKKLFELNIFVPFLEQPDWHQNQNPYKKTLQCKYFTKLVGSKHKSDYSQWEQAHSTEWT